MGEIFLADDYEGLRVCRSRGVRYTPFFLRVNIQRQAMSLYRLGADKKSYQLRRDYRVSTSSFGIGSVANSNKTPLGLHRIARKIGGGYPQGTVFKGRVPVGFTWNGMGDAKIAHRILWLEGLEPGKNKGGDVDTFKRYIYIHGLGEEYTLGRPASHGCIHLAAADLMPLYEKCRVGDLVWIEER